MSVEVIWVTSNYSVPSGSCWIETATHVLVFSENGTFVVGEPKDNHIAPILKQTLPAGIEK